MYVGRRQDNKYSLALKEVHNAYKNKGIVMVNYLKIAKVICIYLFILGMTPIEVFPHYIEILVRTGT